MRRGACARLGRGALNRRRAAAVEGVRVARRDGALGGSAGDERAPRRREVVREEAVQRDAEIRGIREIRAAVGEREARRLEEPVERLLARGRRRERVALEDV